MIFHVLSITEYVVLLMKLSYLGFQVPTCACATNGRRRIWWTVDPGAICFLGGGAMVKCQESVYPCKFTYYLMISSFRMIQTLNDNVVKMDIIGHIQLQHLKFSILIHITMLAIFNLKLRYFVNV